MAERISPLARRVGRTHEQVDRAEVLLFKSEGFADTSLDAVAVGRSGGMLAGNQDSETRLTRTTPLEIKRITARRASFPLAQQPLELSLAPQAAARVEAKSLKRRRLRRLQRETPATARAAIAQHLASAGRAATHEESVAPSAPGLGRLVSPLRGHGDRSEKGGY
jgi:hypothetical protein